MTAFMDGANAGVSAVFRHSWDRSNTPILTADVVHNNLAVPPVARLGHRSLPVLRCGSVKQLPTRWCDSLSSYPKCGPTDWRPPLSTTRR